MTPPADPSPETIDIVVNDRPRNIAAQTALASLLDDLALSGRPGLAVAVNASVVPRADWPTRLLRNGDRILVIHASQGG